MKPEMISSATKRGGMLYAINLLRSSLHCGVLLAAPLIGLLAVSAAQAPTQNPPSGDEVRQSGPAGAKSYPPALIQSGNSLFQQNCSFCHGRDAAGGESGPDLTRSKLVTADVGGDKIGPVVLNGRVEKGMPHFDFSVEQIAGLAAFIHAQRDTGLTKKGGRRGVDVSDLQTGNAESGKKYFDGRGGCTSCHSPTGDLAGIASRYKGLELEEQMLYPKHAKSRVEVTLRSGQTVTGVLEYLDEFTVGLIDSAGSYRSWRTGDVEYKVDAPVNAHVELFSKYTDADIHDLMAYLQTLR
jgi:cytochrome c oxidase cbb3-type subunit 3